MGEYARNPLAVSAFGIVMAVNTVLFIVLHAYILRHLIKPDLVDAQDPQITPLFFIVPPTRRTVVAPRAAS